MMTAMQVDRLQVSDAALRELCSRHAITRLGFFGSAVQGTATAASDLDIVVEFAPGKTPGLFTFAAIQLELSTLLCRRVDLKTPQDLSPYFREHVLRTTVWSDAA